MSCITNEVQCKSCKSQELTEEYDGAPLTCTNCGLVGEVEPVPDVDDLISGFGVFDMNEFRMNPELLKMVEEYLAKNKEQLGIAGISKLMKNLYLKP